MGSSINGVPNSWMVFFGKILLTWMIWGYPFFRKPPYRYNLPQNQSKSSLPVTGVIEHSLLENPPFGFSMAMAATLCWMTPVTGNRVTKRWSCYQWEFQDSPWNLGLKIGPKYLESVPPINRFLLHGHVSSLKDLSQTLKKSMAFHAELSSDQDWKDETKKSPTGKQVSKRTGHD